MADQATEQEHPSAEEMGRKWIPYAGRAGYATKGVVYLIVGGLAAVAGWGAGGQTTDPDRQGTDATGILTRLGYLDSGLAHGLLACGPLRRPIVI